MDPTGAASAAGRLDSSGATREHLVVLEQETEAMKNRCKKLIKSLQTMSAAATAFDEATKAFNEDIRGVIQSFGTETQEIATKLVDGLVELTTKHSTVIRSQENMLSNPLRDLVENGSVKTEVIVGRLNDARKDYEMNTEKLHNLRKKALDGSSDKLSEKVQRQEAEETKARQQLDSVSTEYAGRMKDVLFEAQSTVTNGLINYFREYNSMCRNGTKLWTDLEPQCKKFAEHLAHAKKHPEEMLKDESKRASEPRTGQASGVSASAAHVAAVAAAGSPLIGTLAAGQAPDVEKQVKQGYLWVKNKKKGGPWKKRWVSVINGRLMYYKSWKTTEPKETFTLMMCSVKRWDDSSKPFGFELQSADMRNMIFCANEEKELQHWLDVINGIITSLFNAMHSGDGSAKEGATGAQEENNAYAELMQVKGNEVCADCGRADPDWAVMNHGITICIECSGVHRSLGVHISKVRSLKLDHWDPELLLMMKSIGNVKSNASVYEASLTEKDRIPHNADRTRREAFIKAKYVEKKWVPPVASASMIVSMLIKKKRSVPVVSILKLLAQGAEPNWQDPDEGVSLLHRAAADDNLTGMELLSTVGAKLDIQDKAGRTPLHYAAKENSAAAVRLLLTHGASTDINDAEGKTPLTVAKESNAVDASVLLDPSMSDLDEGVDSTPGTPGGLMIDHSNPASAKKTPRGLNIQISSAKAGGSTADSLNSHVSPRGQSSSAVLLSPREKNRARRTMTLSDDPRSREEFMRALEAHGDEGATGMAKSPSNESIQKSPSTSAIRGPSPRAGDSGAGTSSPAPLAALKSLTADSSRKRTVSESPRKEPSSSKDKDKEKEAKERSSASSSSKSSSRTNSEKDLKPKTHSKSPSEDDKDKEHKSSSRHERQKSSSRTSADDKGDEPAKTPRSEGDRRPLKASGTITASSPSSHSSPGPQPPSGPSSPATPHKK